MCGLILSIVFYHLRFKEFLLFKMKALHTIIIIIDEKFKLVLKTKITAYNIA